MSQRPGGTGGAMREILHFQNAELDVNVDPG